MAQFSPQSKSGLCVGGELDQGEAEVMAGRKEQDHRAGPLETTDTAAPSLRPQLYLTVTTDRRRLYIRNEPCGADKLSLTEDVL